MQLVIVGTHQRTCPVSVRERLAFGAERMGEALALLQQYADEGFILSTCNRVELGGLVAGGEQNLIRFLADWHHISPEMMAPHLYVHTGADAVRHLFRLAAGLDSMVLGEDQVMGQIKAALAEAQAAGTTGQRITEIARSHLSTVSVALDIARDSLGDLRRRHVVIVGAGRMGELALKHLRGEPPRSVVVVNRTYERARDLADSYGWDALPIDRLEEALRQADVVLTCTASPEVVIDAPMVERARSGRTAPQSRQAALLLLDLAVPRDVDPQVADLPCARLFDIDNMRMICDANRASRVAEVARAEALVDVEVTKFMEWWAAQEVVPTIRALRERAESIRQAEIERTLAKLPDLSERQQQAILALSTAIVNKILHQPIATLKGSATDGELALAVQQLFQLKG